MFERATALQCIATGTVPGTRIAVSSSVTLAPLRFGCRATFRRALQAASSMSSMNLVGRTERVLQSSKMSKGG
ncbi:MAG TPA: hypothetical protein DCQ06_03230 [Myxococcales bacterium]|nr:hypothetical protein [Myxococcales bacterium]